MDFEGLNKEQIIEKIKTRPLVQKLVKDYSTLTTYRNRINHGTMLEGKGQFKNVDVIARDIIELTNTIYNLTYCTNL